MSLILTLTLTNNYSLGLYYFFCVLLWPFFAPWTRVCPSITVHLCTKQLYAQRKWNIPMSFLTKSRHKWSLGITRICRHIVEDGGWITWSKTEPWNACCFVISCLRIKHREHLWSVKWILQKLSPQFWANNYMWEQNTKYTCWKHYLRVLPKWTAILLKQPTFWRLSKIFVLLLLPSSKGCLLPKCLKVI